MRVVVDPGHAGRNIDPGAVNATTGLQEAGVALSVSRLVEKYLLAVGYEVKLTRIDWEQAETDDLSYRTALANDWGADIFISLHCNSAENPRAEGYEVWTSPGDTLEIHLRHASMGKLLPSFPIGLAERITLTAIPIRSRVSMYWFIPTLLPAWWKWRSFQTMRKRHYWRTPHGRTGMRERLRGE